MESQKSKGKSSILIVVVVILVALVGGSGYLYYQTTALQDQVSSLQGLAKAGASIKIANWYGSQSGNSYTYEVKVTNGNSFDVTLKQLTISVVDNTGAQVSGNTLAPQVLISAGNSVTTEISVNFPNNAYGHSIQAIISTPFGDVTIGSG